MNIRYPIYEGVYRILTFNTYYLFLPIAKIKNLIDNHRGKIEQDGCNNQSRTDYCTIFHPSDYFQQGLLKEIQCPVVHPLHVWNSFLELNR